MDEREMMYKLSDLSKKVETYAPRQHFEKKQNRYAEPYNRLLYIYCMLVVVD
jgi:hypothetical protein